MDIIKSNRELSSVLCDDLDGWDGGGVGGRSKRELIRFLVQQKLTQHCKEIILQFKKKRVNIRDKYKRQ